MTPSVLMCCERCGESVERIEDGGWKCTADRRDIYAHHGLCPSEEAALWRERDAYRMRMNAQGLETGLGNPELAVEPIPESL